MNSGSGYRVDFGKIARTILYEDSKGTLCFTFDADSSTKPQTVFLERQSNAQLNPDEQLRIDLALNRTKEYLHSCGYQVQVV
jgi:hypothetical protein